MRQHEVYIALCLPLVGQELERVVCVGLQAQRQWNCIDH